MASIYIVTNENDVVVTASTTPIEGGIEVLVDDVMDIIYYMNNYAYIDGELVRDSQASIDYISARDLEVHLDELRIQRKKYLQSFDTYKTNVAYGIEVENEADKSLITKWYRDILDLKEEAFVNVPERVVYYFQIV